jgi:uncharacterized surface protein with fasciclin (FAS1) repeats
MKKQGIRLLVVALLTCLGVAFALESNEDITILQGLQEDENFTTLVSLLESSGLSADLGAGGDITLFAPTNDAFDALGAEQLTSLSNDAAALTEVLQLHVMQGGYSVLDLNGAEEGSLSSLSGEPYVIAQSGGGLTVNGADLVSTDVDNVYSNGIVHVISNVIVPAGMMANADTNGDGVVDAADATAGGVTGMVLTDVNADGVIDANDVADSNNDGVVDELDYTAAGLTDSNGDGVVDELDITTLDTTTTDTTATDSSGATMMNPTLTLTDTNGDGTLDVADVTDTNNDGVVDEADYIAVGMTDTNNDGVIDDNDTVMTGEMTSTSTTLVSDSDSDNQNNCEDNDDMIDSDGDGTDTDQCNSATQ